MRVEDDKEEEGLPKPYTFPSASGLYSARSGMFIAGGYRYKEEKRCSVSEAVLLKLNGRLI